MSNGKVGFIRWPGLDLSTYILYYWCTIYFYSKFLTLSNLYCRKKDHGITCEVYIVVSICLFWCIVFAYIYQVFHQIHILQNNGWSSSTQDGKVVEIYELLYLEDSWCSCMSIHVDLWLLPYHPVYLSMYVSLTSTYLRWIIMV